MYPDYSRIVRPKQDKDPAPIPWRVLSAQDKQDYKFEIIEKIRWEDKKGFLGNYFPAYQGQTPFCTFYAAAACAFQHLSEKEQEIVKKAFDNKVFLKNAHYHFSRTKTEWVKLNLLPRAWRGGGFTLRMGMRALQKGINIGGGYILKCEQYFKIDLRNTIIRDPENGVFKKAPCYNRVLRLNQIVEKHGPVYVGYSTDGQLDSRGVLRWTGKMKRMHASVCVGKDKKRKSLSSEITCMDNSWRGNWDPTLIDSIDHRCIQEAWYANKCSLINVLD